MIKFAIISDPQIGNFRRPHYSRFLGYRSQVKKLRKVVDNLNRIDLDYVFLLGDIANENPDGDPKLRLKQLELVTKELGKLKHPLKAIPGNHDLSKKNFSKDIDRSCLKNWKNIFALDDYFSFTDKGVQFVFLNSEYYESTRKSSWFGKTAQTPEHPQSEWLANTMRISANIRKRIIFTHIPPLPRTLTPSNIADIKNAEDIYSLQYMLKTILKAEKPPSQIFCGHTHFNFETFTEFKIDRDMFESTHTINQISTRSCSAQNFHQNTKIPGWKLMPRKGGHGYRFVEIDDNYNLSHKFINL